MISQFAIPFLFVYLSLCCAYTTTASQNKKIILVRDPMNIADTFESDRVAHYARRDNGKRLNVIEKYFNNQRLDSPQQFCEVIWKLNTAFPPDKGCLLYDRLGNIVSDYASLENNSAVSIVPEGLPFVWPTDKVGDVISVPGGPTDKLIELETVSLEPRVFRVRNFLTNEEVDAMVDFARTSKMEQSTVGEIIKGKVGQNLGAVAYDRTSTNTWDTDSPRSKELQQRAFNLLRMEYHVDKSDGFQILRYTPGQFYNSHVDWFEIKEHDAQQSYDVSRGGANRVATMFLYLSDVEIGGETVFPEGMDQVEDNSTRARGEQLRNQMVENGVFKKNGLEWNLFDTCRQKMSVKPVKGELILFYNIDSRGVLDSKAIHGACPPLSEDKWGANLWIWNGPHHIELGRVCDFYNDSDEPIEIFWRNHNGAEDFLDSIEPRGGKYRSFTFADHVFVLRSVPHPEQAWTYTIASEPEEQVFRVAAGDRGTFRPLPKTDL